MIHAGQTDFLSCSLVSILYTHPFFLPSEKQKKILFWVYADKGFVLSQSSYYCLRFGASAESFMPSPLLM